jgi:FixJ family two-component response regulator
MRSHGFDAEPFYSADAILASANLLKSDCIIADIDMPGTSGIGLVQQNCRAD